MACVALTSLMATIKLEFLQPNPSRVPLDDEGGFVSMESLYEKLSSLQGFVQKKSGARGGTAIRDLEIQIRDFALNAEDRIEMQLSNFLLAKNGEDQQKAYQQLHQTLGEAAENAAELLEKSKETEVVNESEGPLLMIPCLKHASASEPTNFMVGRRGDRERIIDKLVRFDEKLKAVSIVGMVGIGKTTLISSVYQDPVVASYFDVRRWVSMPDGHSLSQILHTLLWTVLAEAEEIKKGRIPDDDDDLAANQVFKCLNGKRYLIVLDNLWNNQDWYVLRSCLPDNYNGSRIVITTRHFLRREGNYVYSNTNIIHNMTLLNPEESWTLFCNNPFLKLERHKAPPIFQEIRSQVIEICEGLPYSIVVVAKRLSKCDNIKQEWKKVAKEIELLGVLDRKTLTHTYNQLPQYLKACFLYFGVFPKRSAINVKLLIRLWIAEGFINPLEGKELESQAYEYLKEFIDRSLILIDTWSSSGKIKNCRMHSALHSFCEDAEIFVSFKLLRILAFVPSSFLQRVPTRLHDLVFLRYLSVSEWFEGLEYVVSTNRNLQSLVVSGKEFQFGAPTLHLPCTIWELPQLRHLKLDKSYVIDPPSIDKDNMRTLSWVCSPHCRAGVYCRFPNIEKLKVFVFTRNNLIILDNLEYLERLEGLSILVSFGCVVTLPMPSMFPSQLKKLRLNGTDLSERDLKAIEMLPQLEVLKLENAFHGEVWKVEEGFCQLKFLLLENKKLKQWTVNYGFSRLKHLVLKFCYCLEEIPMRIGCFGLESIELQRCCPSVITSAKRIEVFKHHEYRTKFFELKIIGEESIPLDDE
ncbi:PREDICTED: putative late blight resistance protein homolog R1B-17 [Ipomoea nil]|uniref:putative late blight resistance protein homolog R1B-17 n=1 Tax=Ipomoea nil TaxID=35883 RepID=UPI000900E0B3|nr:PREDICTED: putative late blight resistance protein homolog R1B-17 [Ipomoea nil]